MTAPSRRIHLSPPSVGGRERERLLQAFDSGWIAPAGPDLPAFEAEVAALTGRRQKPEILPKPRKPLLQ